MERRNGKETGRRWRRMRVLELLDQGRNLREVGEAMSCYPREVRRVGWRYLEGGLEHALADDVRPKPERKLDSKQESAVIALACTDPPSGYSRWTIRLLAEHAVKKGIVVELGRETVRRTLQEHDLKPWREKNVVRSGTHARVRRSDGEGARPARTSARPS
jgi:hypothetical protein